MRLREITLAGYAVGLLAGVGLVATYGAMEVSSTPRFCGSCHVMEPYYESWVTSSHANIACVDCHIPPGITAEFRKKYEALSMVARYFTGTYGTNPWAEVEDSACLECHERRLLAGSEVFGDVLFDHRPHLTELRRGKRLRCTSCHSQIVQGSHITVTATSCILCHFKGETARSGASRCTLCHQIPEGVVDAGGLAFDHGDVARFDMDCESCHTPPRPDAGGVPRERCVTCHNDPVRLAAYGDGDLLHKTHVTDHKVECTHCHLEIEHVAPRHAEATTSECGACHGGGHTPARDLYAGLGGKGVPPMPDAMYRAGVRCEGCHFEDGGGAARKAGAVSCMSCHGPGYLKIYEGWRRSLAERVGGVRRALDATSRAVGGAVPALADARANVELVERGRGIHNLRFSLALLDAAHEQLNEARSGRGLGRLPAPWRQAAAAGDCGECHAGAELATVDAFGRRFPHERHAVTAGLACERCHRTHEERAAAGGEGLKIGAGSCQACHHAEGSEASDCAACHADLGERAFPVELGDFSHAVHVDDMGLDCGDCHGAAPAFARAPDPAVCSDCH